MKKLTLSKNETLFFILRDMRKPDISHTNHAKYLGRCQKDTGYLLRRMLRNFGIKVRLFPRGKGNWGMTRGTIRLRNAAECAVYTTNCTVDEAFAKIFSKHTGIRWSLGEIQNALPSSAT